MLKRNEMLVEEFCNEVGVDRRVLKVWMHKNKNPSRKREIGELHIAYMEEWV
jgi:predicted site-specific integrase-resolvase